MYMPYLLRPTSQVLISDAAVEVASTAHSLLIDATPVEIDSLLNGVYFPAYLQNATMMEFAKACPGPAGLCAAPYIWAGPVTLTSSDINAYPTLVLTNLDIASPISLAPSDYLIKNTDGTYSMGLKFDGTRFKVGISFLAKYHIGIDLLFPGGYGRVGFAPISTCADSNSLTATDQATTTSAVSSTTSTQATTVSSTTNAARTTTLSSETSATASSIRSLSAASTQSTAVSSLSVSATGNAVAQASTTSSVSTSTTAYVAATTQAASTSRVTASTRCVL